MKQSLLTIIAIFTVVSCHQPTQLTENDKKNIIRQVHHTLNNYYEDIKRSGLTAEFEYLDNSSDFFWLPPGYSYSISYDSVSIILKQNAPKYKLIDNSFDTLMIVPLSKELATYSARLQSIMTDTSDNTSTCSLLETRLMIKRKEGWKLLSGQTAILTPNM